MRVKFGDKRLPQRFWDKVEPGVISDVPGFERSMCWIWMGAKTGKGYSNFNFGGRFWGGHRLAYVELIGAVPEGLELDHLCRVRHCVRPSHLEPVSQTTNTLRGVGESAQNARKTHCVHGHEFNRVNTYISKLGKRMCRECNRIRALVWSENNREEKNAKALDYYWSNRGRILARVKRRRNG